MRRAAASACRRPSSERCRPGARPGSLMPVVGVAPWRTSSTNVGRAPRDTAPDDTAAPAAPQAVPSIMAGGLRYDRRAPEHTTRRRMMNLVRSRWLLAVLSLATLTLGA